jgi:hypothetical protein
VSGGGRPPKGVGKLIDEPVPEWLLNIGAVVRFPNGTEGVVQHYQYYFAKQQTFPVVNSRGVTHICTASDVTVVEQPVVLTSAAVPRQRRGVQAPFVGAAPVLLG